MRRIVLSLATTAALTLGALPAGAAVLAPGDLDPAFSGGVATTKVGARTTWRAVTLMGAKPVVAGNSLAPGAGDAILARYTAGGRLDRTFGHQGIARVHIKDADIYFTDVAKSTDGGLVAVGTAELGPALRVRFLVAKFHANGLPDRSFGDGGVTLTGFGHFEAYAYAVTALPRGKVAVSGTASFPDDGTGSIAVARYQRSGALDTTFNGTGKTLTSLPARTASSGMALVKASQGRLVAVGHSGGSSGAGIALVRLTKRGQLDPTFGTGGTSEVELGDDDWAHDAVPLADDSLILTGRHVGTSGRSVGYVAKVTPTGHLDTTWASGTGYVDVPVPGHDAYLVDIAKAPGGRFVAVGDVALGGNPQAWQSVVVRVNANGTLDSTFGTGGILVRALEADRSALEGVMVMPDKRIVGAGYSGRRGAVVRLLG
jgi:uncharacterized delta-60 repeat protein